MGGATDTISIRKAKAAGEPVITVSA